MIHVALVIAAIDWSVLVGQGRQNRHEQRRDHSEACLNMYKIIPDSPQLVQTNEKSILRSQTAGRTKTKSLQRLHVTTRVTSAPGRLRCVCVVYRFVKRDLCPGAVSVCTSDKPQLRVSGFT